MKKLFTFLLALVGSVGMSWAATKTVTWTQSQLESLGNLSAGKSTTIGGVKLTVNTGNASKSSLWGANFIGTNENSFTFSIESGNLKRIEVSTLFNFDRMTATGWSNGVWTGNASSVNMGRSVEAVTQIVFTYDEIFYSVTYNGNGNTSGSVPATAQYVKNSTVTVAGNTGNLKKTGYTFANWKTGSTTYTAGKTFKITSNVTLTAQWTANKYTVTLDHQGGNGGSTSVSATYNAAMPSATMPTHTGYTFQGYYDAKSGGNMYYKANGSSNQNWNKAAHTTLYARWSAINYTITYCSKS